MHQPVKWYQNWRWIAAVAAFFASIAVSALAATTVVNSAHIDDLSVLAERNSKAITGIENNQAGIDELVAFVHDVQLRQGQGGNQSQLFIDLLCSSSDPVRLAACAELTNPEVP